MIANLLTLLTLTREQLLSRLSTVADTGQRLKTSPPNSKTKHMLAWLLDKLGIRVRPSEFKSISLLSGVSCPGAKDCKSQAVTIDGKRRIQDGPSCRFRCFSATSEVQYEDTYNQRKHNRNIVLANHKDPITLAAIILWSISSKCKLVRIHIGGDFLSAGYLVAWILAARVHTNCRFYTYTKSLHLLDKLGLTADNLPPNMRIILSEGGLFDAMIPSLKAKGFHTSKVVFTEQQAADLGLEIDHKDNLAAYGDSSFALLIHGPQPMGSEASKAISKLKAKGDNGYNPTQARE